MNESCVSVVRWKRWAFWGGMVFVILAPAYMFLPTKSRLVGAWDSGGIFLTGSLTIELWHDGVFRSTQSGILVHEGVWRLRGFTFEMEVVTQKSELLGQPSRVYDYKTFTVFMRGPRSLRMSKVGTLHRFPYLDQTRTLRGDGWPKSPRRPLPFFTAVREGRLQEVADYLATDRKLATQRYFDGLSALVSACWAGDSSMVKMLLEHGADPNAGNNHGIPAISLAIARHDDLQALPIVDLLLAAGANPNQRGGDRSTPLQCAVVRRNIKCAERLLAKGADPLLHTRAGKSLLQIATESNHIEMIELLRKSIPEQKRSSQCP